MKLFFMNLQPYDWLHLNFCCVCDILLFSEEGKQKRLTEWCETVGTSSVGGKRTQVLAPGFLHASGCGDKEDEGFIKL
ncbi:hypothetical protein XENOCAPTIV_011234, partial [Xenoophorus captivus]